MDSGLDSTPRSPGKHDPGRSRAGGSPGHGEGAALVHEYRRLCITGFRLTRGQMAEGRIGATPTRVIMLETLAGIVRRRHRNALLAPNDTPDVRVDTIYNEARRALIQTYAHTRRRALDEEKEYERHCDAEFQQDSCGDAERSSSARGRNLARGHNGRERKADRQ